MASYIAFCDSLNFDCALCRNTAFLPVLNSHAGVNPGDSQGLCQRQLAAHVFYCLFKTIAHSVMVNDLFTVCQQLVYLRGNGMRINLKFMGNKLTTQQLEKILKERGIEESAIKRGLEIYPQKYNNWKKRGIPADEWPRLSAYIGISIDELVGDKKQAAPKFKGDRQDLHEIIDRLPPRLLVKARSALKFFVVEDPAASQKARKKRT